MGMNRRVLEISYGGCPLGNLNNRDLRHFARQIPPGVEYYGIDFPLMEHSLYSPYRFRKCDVEAFELQHRLAHRPGISLFRMDASRMGFEDAVFHEVHLYNVVTDILMTDSAIFAILSEARRVLAASGACIVSGQKDDNGSRSLASHLMENAGFCMLPEGSLDGATVFAREIRGGYLFKESFHLVGRKE